MEASSAPTLFIVAGPNGAGKTSLSNDILKKHKVEAFDWDFEYDQFWAEFNYDSDRTIKESARERATEKFISLYHAALKEKRNFAFEANFHLKEHVDWAQKAKQAGHHIVLIFMYMKSVELCIERVVERVKYGGHHVEELDIRKRYSKGLQHLNEYFSIFDNVIIFDASLTWEIAIIAEFNKGKPNYKSNKRLKENGGLLELPSLRLTMS